MTLRRSKVSRFKSPSTGEYCTIAQYIAEILVQRKAEKENKGSLSYKFWNKTQKSAYTRQVQAVSKLIKEFGEKKVYDYIININKRVYSAQPKWVKEEISKHEVQEVQEKVSDIEHVDVNKKPRKAFGKKTLFSKLRTNDGKKER
jgi:hypothetical protein